MKKIFLLLLISATALAAPPKKSARPAQSRTAKASPKQVQKSAITAAVNQIKNGQYLSAANNLLALSRRPELQSERSQIKFLLGLALMELNLNQVATFQFVDVIKIGDPRFVKKALEKLLVVTDKLGDETLLNYAIQRIDINTLPKASQELIYFRLGEIKQKAGQFSEANSMYSQVNPGSRYYLNSLYNLGLVQAEAGQTDLALATFRKLVNTRSKADVTDTNKVAAQIAIARTLYQKKDWEKSIEAFSLIPRDHALWHDSVFEQSWAMFRAARFRSALSNFQTLHSSYYDDFYIPESLLLRSIVYLYICKYDEMDKVLSLFDKQYGNVGTQIQRFLEGRNNAEAYYREVERAYAYKYEDRAKVKGKLPYIATRFIANEGNVRRSLSYIKKIIKERKLIEEDSRIKTLAIGLYSLKLLNNRIKSAKDRTGDMVKAHLQNMSTELVDLREQASLIRYEMINGKKETLKKRLTEKDINDKTDTDDKSREFYAQNGYEYYPFQGEFWLDEVGNYHYLGKQSCE
jgi:Tetratricopeptide repeat